MDYNETIYPEQSPREEIKEGVYAPKNHTGFLIGKDDEIK